MVMFPIENMLSVKIGLSAENPDGIISILRIMTGCLDYFGQFYEICPIGSYLSADRFPLTG
jgi:hypothetical protein